MTKQYQALFLLTAITVTTARTSKEALNFIQSSCQTTTYQSLCVDTLSVYANTIQTSPRHLVESAIAVSLNQAVATKLFVSNLIRKSQFRTLQDCAPFADLLTDSTNTVQELERCNSWTDCLFHISNAETSTISAESNLVSNTCSSRFSGPVKMSVQGRISGAVKKSLLARLVNLEHEINNAKLLFIAFAKN